MKSDIRSSIVMSLPGVLLKAENNPIKNDDGSTTEMVKFSFKVDAFVAEIDKVVPHGQMPNRSNFQLYVMSDQTETLDLLTSIPADTPYWFRVTPSGKSNGKRDVSGVRFELIDARPATAE